MNVKLELIGNIGIEKTSQQMVRGDIGNITHRFAKANNKYFANFNENEDSSCIIYLDVNNLYGRAMIQPLPEGKLSFVDFVENYVDEGAIIECDHIYIDNLHGSL